MAGYLSFGTGNPRLKEGTGLGSGEGTRDLHLEITVKCLGSQSFGTSPSPPPHNNQHPFPPPGQFPSFQNTKVKRARPFTWESQSLAEVEKIRRR
jgi:hypothetical protein